MYIHLTIVPSHLSKTYTLFLEHPSQQSLDVRHLVSFSELKEQLNKVLLLYSKRSPVKQHIKQTSPSPYSLDGDEGLCSKHVFEEHVQKLLRV